MPASVFDMLRIEGTNKYKRPRRMVPSSKVSGAPVAVLQPRPPGGREQSAREGRTAAMNRRQFLPCLAGLGLPMLEAGWIRRARAAVPQPVRGVYALELDGVRVGSVSAVSGGETVGDVVIEQPGPDGIRHKHLAGYRVEPMSIEIGLPMAKSAYAWLKSSFDPNAKPMRKGGAIVTLDPTGRAVARREFRNAVVTEVDFPVCDTESKDAAALSVTFLPEMVTPVAPNASAPAQQDFSRAPHLLSSNFRLSIQGLEAATTRARKVEAMAIRIATASGARTGVDIPDLIVMIPESSAKPMYDWHRDFVIAKKSTQERAGLLEYLTPDLRSALLSLNLFNLGVVKVAPEAPGPGSRVALTKVEMYCEAVTADFKA